MSSPALVKPAISARKKGPPGGPLFALLNPYRGLVFALLLMTIAGNALNLVVPKLISRAIDSYTRNTLVLDRVILQFVLVAVLVFALSYLQSVLQTYASERVARDLRTRLARKISTQSYAYVEGITPAKLLTNLTSDVDAVKLFVSQAIATLIASVFLILGAGILLLSINWRLGLSILGVVPFIGITFQLVLKRVRPQFQKA
jgi:ATP-binding cassette subfamily B protein